MQRINQADDEFQEIATRTIDAKYRITIGKLIDGCKRVKIYKNREGEILLKPLVELPASEVWLFKDKEALKSIKRGLCDAADGNIEKLNLDEF
ncbi:MAG: hypothetical protein GXP61_00370 [Epsilonproteobacteria bacterium]|nr:hypothetical protein [Campylobacterota bacterium]